MIMKRLLAYLGVVLLACGCGLDELALSDACGSLIEFSASKMRVITKAGDSAEPFAEETNFRLFAVQNVGNVSDWSAAGVKFHDVEGIGSASGKVDYSIDGKKASYDVGRNLDFYGLTYGTSSEVSIIGDAGSAPSVSLSLADGSFPDLMYSDNLKNKNSSSGLLQMEFRHTLSKLKFEVLKQDETADDDKKLTNVVLKKVVLKGSAASAVFNAGSGEWSYETSSVQNRVVYEPATGLKITESAQMLKSGEDVIEMLAVPNTGQLTLEVTLDMDGDTGDQDYKVVEYALMASETEKLVLEQNHEYTFSIVVLKNDVRIVTVTPKVYEWIDVELDTGDAYFGQPVYFGGLMWMDRNLGAKSADCENDWYNTIGYYYQHGRNIPYILDVDVWKAHFKSITGNNNLRFDEQAGPVKFQFPYGVVYGLDDDGRKVSDVLDLQYEFKVYEDIAVNPGDVGKDYRFILGLSPSLAIASHSWAVQKTDVVSSRYYYVNNDVSTTKYYYKEDSRNDTYWSSDVENQPCPKGWRLPTREDLYGFMPEYTGSMTWQSSYTKGTSLKAATSTSTNFYYSATSGNPFDNSYTWKYLAGKFDVDKTVSPEVAYSDPVPAVLGRVYGIKYEGTDKAYRVMFEQIKANVEDDDAERLYVRVSRFNASEEDVFLVNGSQWNLHKFDWSTPVEYMDFPLCGFFDSYGFIDDFGDGCIMRISDSDGEGRNWTIYLRNAYRGVSVGATSCRTLGDQIRCVRDVNAK